MNDDVNHPKHYTYGGMETIDYLKAKMTEERFLGFLQGNVLKYISRASHKGKEAEDMAKAQWYLERLVKEMVNEVPEMPQQDKGFGQPITF